MKKWYEERKIPLLGFIAFLIMMSFLTIIFNWFWSGLGTDPTHYFRLPFTTNEDEFKDYATLYVALLSFGASLFAGLVVFLVFNDWKDQHNTEIENEYIQKILEELRKLTEIHEHLGEIFESFYNDNKNIFEENKEYEFDKYPVSIIESSDKVLYNLFFEYSLINKDKKLSELFQIYRVKSFHLIKKNNEILEILNNPNISTYETIYDIFNILDSRQMITYTSEDKKETNIPFQYYQIGELANTAYIDLYRYILEHKVKIR